MQWKDVFLSRGKYIILMSFQSMTTACAHQHGFVGPEVTITWRWRRPVIIKELQNTCESPGQLPERGRPKLVGNCSHTPSAQWGEQGKSLQAALSEVKERKKTQAGIFIWLIFFPRISCLNGETCWSKKWEKPWTEWLRLPGPEI